MAVAKVFGRIDGTDILFEQTTGNRWEISVPRDADGQYIVEIISEDEAGNQSYLAKFLWVVNTSLLCTHLEPLPYYASLLPSGFMAEPIGRWTAETCGNRLCVTMEPKGWCVELVEPRCSQGGG